MSLSLMLLLSLLLYHAPANEIVSEDNSLDNSYCITDCDASSVTLSNGRMMFDGNRTCGISYTSTSGSEGTMTLVFGCDVPDGTGMTLEYVTYGTIHTVTGEFKDSECCIQLDDVKCKGLTEIYGNVDYDGDNDLEMTVYSIDKEGNISHTWCE
ncbi:MAG: hypothetical protein IKQ93_08275 [Candidatus Methanomethylophilaceae archaeon]|nr:hypothetical protein [Candidatus Methanomethylophilaceae archaeon]